MPWAVATVAPRFGYIKERQWHHGRGYEDHPDSSLIVKFHLSDLRDIKRWSMFCGTDREALGLPEHHITRRGRYQSFPGRGCNSRRLQFSGYNTFHNKDFGLRRARVGFPRPYFCDDAGLGLFGDGELVWLGV